MPLTTRPLKPATTPKGALELDIAATGPAIPPIERLRYMSPTNWEDFVLEWASSLKSKYARVEKHSGSGDLGLDVIGFESGASEDPWDNYQCKHYDHPLRPSEIWLELGKLSFYTYRGDYSVPRQYTFVAPQGAGTSLAKLLRKPEETKARLLVEWDKYCRTRISSTQEVTLDASLRKHIEDFDFRIVTAIPPLTLIDEHRQTPYFAYRFGGGLPSRAPVKLPPVDPGPVETTYVRALLDAYEDRLGAPVQSHQDLMDDFLQGHFARSRREFFSAESLREFSRDNVPPGTFEDLLDNIHDGVVDVEQAQHADAVERVLAVVKHAKAIQLTANALVARTYSADRGGMCHQLANEMRLRWRK